ncbi:MAG: GTP cyclohydrolase I FolE [Planctomycetes bacterium]|nr:GTP cyclohydrolase I FolE [Planctomycetota bacterium]
MHALPERRNRLEPTAVADAQPPRLRAVQLPAGPDVRPTQEQALSAVRTLLAWIGEDPDREGLRETPARVLRAYREFFAGYGADVEALLAKTFGELDGYEDVVVVRGIEVLSHCEHHMVPFRGHAAVAYLPAERVVGLSKLARLVDVFARRLQVQERLTAQIGGALERALQPRGVAVRIVAEHHCMTTRGVGKTGSATETTWFAGVFRRDPEQRREVLQQLRDE